MKCSFVPRAFTRSSAARQTALPAISPSVTALVMRTISWSTMRPAPMFWWPTSLLPITPSGTPTSRPHALTSVTGYCACSQSSQGLRARCTALNLSWAGFGFLPQPSRTTRSTGRRFELMANGSLAGGADERRFAEQTSP